uniref:interferon alpha-21-like n=1 Tax=Pristiophorus japonicus TaxID=55135 RepID=UPI00398F1FA6
MLFPSVGRLWILLALLPGTLSQDCQRLRLLEEINNEALHVLREMGKPFPLQCLSERASLSNNSLNIHQLSNRVQSQDRIQIVHQTLRHLTKIYSMNLGSVTWSRDKVETFRLLLDGQVGELEECVRKPGSDSRPRRFSSINKYFKKLRMFLEQKTFSDCAWEIVRVETRARLQQIRTIMGNIRRDFP